MSNRNFYFSRSTFLFALGISAALALGGYWIWSESRLEGERQALAIQRVVAAGLEISKGNPRPLQNLLASLPGPPSFSSLEIRNKSDRIVEVHFEDARQSWLSRLFPAGEPWELPLDAKSSLILRLVPSPIPGSFSRAAYLALPALVLVCLTPPLLAWLLAKRLSFRQIGDQRWANVLPPPGIVKPAAVSPEPLPAMAPAEDLIGFLPEAVLCSDADGRVTFLNAAARTLLGLTQAAENLRLIELFTPWERPRLAAILDAIHLQGKRETLETQLLTPRGGILPVTVSYTSLPNTGGLILILQDSSRSRAQQDELALRNLLLDALPHGLAVLSPEDHGKLVYCNPAFRSLLSIDPSAELLPDTLAANLRESVFSRFRTAGDGGESIHLNWQHTKNDPTTIELLITPTHLDAKPLFACFASDQSEKSNYRNRVERELARNRWILDVMPLGYCIADDQGKVRAVNTHLGKLTGRSPEQLVGSPIEDWLPLDSRTNGLLCWGDFTIACDNSEKVVKVNTLRLATPTGGYEYVYFFDDITYFKQKAYQDGSELERLQLVLETLAVGVITTNPEGFIQYINPHAQKLTGLIDETCKGIPFGQIIHLIDEKKREPLADPAMRVLRIGKAIRFRQDVLLIGENKLELPVEISASPVCDSKQKVIGSVILMRDVSEQRSLTQQMNIRASRDPLTGLINRRELLALLEGLQLEIEQPNKQFSICYLDLDKFKTINDTCGHQAGDELLRQVSQLMSECLRASDILARIGGDEFCAILRDSNADNAAKAANKIRETIKHYRFAWGGKYFEIGVSIGVVGLRPGTNVEEAISAADQACYLAKEKGRDCVYIYSSEQDEGKPVSVPWNERLSAAIEHDYFRLFRQSAQYLQDAPKPAPRYHEILPQMHEPGQMPIGASTFMPNAQRLHLVSAIERWIIGKLFSSISSNLARPTETQAIYAIPLSAETLGEPGFASFLQELHSRYRVSPEMICFEIDEDDLVQNFSQMQKLLQDYTLAGYQFSLNQFGAGISSFAYIRNLPLSFLKIDISLTQGVETNPVDDAIVRAIQKISEQMKVQTIAQKVDTHARLEHLRLLGLNYALGPIVEEPVSLEPVLPQTKSA